MKSKKLKLSLLLCAYALCSMLLARPVKADVGVVEGLHLLIKVWLFTQTTLQYTMIKLLHLLQ